MKIAPVNLIVSDTGPLISLAVINRLDLLTTFDRPVWITDVVQSECTRDPSKAGAAALKAFFDEGHPFTPRILETPHGAEYRAIIASNPADIEERLRNLGEQSIEHVLKRVSVKAKSFSQEVFSLCVSDDKEFLKTDQPNTHMLSTRAFLVALERKGLIASAEALRDEIKNSGRPKVARSLIDRIHKAKGVETDYKGQLRLPVQDRSEATDRQKTLRAETEEQLGFDPAPTLKF